MNKTLIVAIAMASASFASAQFSYAGGTYTQDFNSLATTGSVTRPTSSTGTTAIAGQLWNNDSTIQGWYSSFENGTNVGAAVPSGTNGNWIGAGVINTPTPHTIPTFDTRFIRISDGTVANPSGATFNYGTVNSTDRALGMLNSGSVASTVPARNTIGLRIKNTSGGTLTSFTLAYWGEQWRQGAGTGNPIPADRIDFSYRVFSAGTFNVDQMPVTVSAGWTNEDNLDFVSLKTGSTQSGLDGNAADNRRFITYTVTGLNWANNDELVMRWTDFDRTGADDGLAVDDLAFSAVPEPGSMIALGLGLAALARKRKSSK